MNDRIELFAALGDLLRGFGADAASREVIARACRANAWFTPEEVVRAVRALADDMLRADVLAEWLRRYPLPARRPRRVLVAMAGNIPLVGFFDLLCVAASGHRCLVKPSAKDTVLTEYVVEALRMLNPRIALEYYDGSQPVEALIATGSDNAARYFKARYADVPMLLRGSRQSVAVLSGRETPGQLGGLADDIWAYSGLGCRNVSLVFVPEAYDLQLTMPAMNEKYRNNYRQMRAVREMTRRPFRDLGGALAVEQQAFPAALCEVAVARYRTTEEVAQWLAEHDGEIQCVVTEMLPHPRRAGFGQAQSPKLSDYPDGLDVMAWLAGL